MTFAMAFGVCVARFSFSSIRQSSDVESCGLKIILCILSGIFPSKVLSFFIFFIAILGSLLGGDFYGLSQVGLFGYICILLSHVCFSCMSLVVSGGYAVRMLLMLCISYFRCHFGGVERVLFMMDYLTR